MNSKLFAIGLLTITAIGVVSLPAHSQNSDTAVIQDATQDTVITGNGNYTEQNTTQTHIENDRRGRGNVGVVQRSGQSSDVLGNNNDTHQDVDQTNVEDGRRNHRSH